MAPRPNRGRELHVEADLARRVAWERERRGWTNDGLARRMTAAGCAMQASAVFKIEKGDPPRRITVNELVAFARVFELQVVDLLQSPDQLNDPAVGGAVIRVETALRELNAAIAAAEDLMARNPEKRNALRILLREFYEDWPEMRRYLKGALAGRRDHSGQPKPHTNPQGSVTEGGQR